MPRGDLRYRTTILCPSRRGSTAARGSQVRGVRAVIPVAVLRLSRWREEHGYRQLEEDSGLDHFEGSAMHDRLPTERHAGRGNSAREWVTVRVLMVRSLVLQPHNEEIAGVGVEHLVAQSVIATSQSCWRASKKGTLPG